MKNKYIKMNNNKDYLSLGNLFNIIKKYSKNTSSAMQVELFCTLFDVYDINKTTINNYLTGYRPISLEYKKVYIELKEKYENDKDVFIEYILKILSILDEHIYIKDFNSVLTINNNKNLNSVCKDLIKLAKEDKNINEIFINKLEKSTLYECFIQVLFYTILENKQPLYIQSIEKEYINDELLEYLKINLYEGISYITSLKELSKKNNMYANAELGSLEYSGIISGKSNYEKSFEYYMLAANKNHPKACWMVSNLILSNKVSIKDYDVMWNYLNRAIKLGSIAAINTLGNCYRLGINPEKKIDLDKAIEYYKEASEYGYVYAYNNLGLIYEEIDIEKSLNYFKLSADLGNSWALNKVGEYYRKQGDLKTAYYYYKESIECPKTERNYYGYYNLAKYYYNIGNKELGIKKDEKLVKDYMNIFKQQKNLE